MTDKVALVTGASSGFGQLTAARLARGGFRVFGTSRRTRADENGVEMLELDVTSSASVDECVRTVLARAGRIDLLVNNAGQAHASLAEETSFEDAMRVFDTNFWGVVRVTSAVLPGMRSRRAGLIVNVGSLAGRLGVPGQAFYAASKHALEGYSESLALELDQFNIRVVVVEPSFFRTSLHHSLARGARPIADYDTVRPRLESALIHAIETGEDPDKVAAAIVAIAATARPALRYRVGSTAIWIPRVRAVVPERLFMWVLRRRFRLL
jgi:NAD(P)-dependent dehydrogenase (short-subunit alcohol dehydrogenase family)